MNEVNQHSDENQSPVNESEVQGLYTPTITGFILSLSSFLFLAILYVALIFDAHSNGWLLKFDKEMLPAIVGALIWQTGMFVALMNGIKEYKTNCHKLLATYLYSALLLFYVTVGAIADIGMMVTIGYLPIVFLSSTSVRNITPKVALITVSIILLAIAFFLIQKYVCDITPILILPIAMLIFLPILIGKKLKNAYGGALKRAGKWMMIERCALALSIVATIAINHAVCVACIVMLVIDFIFCRKFRKALCLCD